MLTIRNEQMRLLFNARARQHAPDIAPAFSAQYPGLHATLGAAGIESFITAAYAKGFGLGFDLARDMSHWLSVCGQFGLDFDAQPEHAWMGAILHDNSISNRSERLRLLVATIAQREEIALHNARVNASQVAPRPLPAWLG